MTMQFRGRTVTVALKPSELAGYKVLWICILNCGVTIKLFPQKEAQFTPHLQGEDAPFLTAFHTLDVVCIVSRGIRSVSPIAINTKAAKEILLEFILQIGATKRVMTLEERTYLT